MAEKEAGFKLELNRGSVNTNSYVLPYVRFVTAQGQHLKVMEYDCKERLKGVSRSPQPVSTDEVYGAALPPAG